MVSQQTDPWFGPRFLYHHGEEHPQLYIGNVPLHLNNSSLTVGNRVYPATEGLLELIFEQKPDINQISTEDSRAYKAILSASNVLRQRYEGGQNLHWRNTTKYRDLIAPMLRIRPARGLRAVD